MFASALQPHRLDAAVFAAEEPELRSGLIQAQLALKEAASFALLIVLAGPDGAGKGPLLFRLYDWLDSRHLRTNAYDRPDKEERRRPPFWRYWRDLPARGEIGVVVGSWYNEPLLRAADGDDDEATLHRKLDHINAFEAMLSAEGIRLLKILPLIAADEERKRVKALQDRRERHVFDEWSTGGTRWRRIRPLAEEAVRRTSTGAAPWLVLPAADPVYRDFTFGRIVLDTLQRNLAGYGLQASTAAPAIIPTFMHKSQLDGLALDNRLKKKAYDEKLAAAQDRLFELMSHKALKRAPMVIVFEGHDAAGKGGAIRRLVRGLDPRRFAVHSIAAPSDEERVRPYLWRFWRRLPAPGRVAIFDRSWYGRVLVERVEGFCTDAEWLRAYGEINDFEEELVEHGHLLVKFWLAISKDEQLKRFEERQRVAFKQYKITEEDWRNREKWDEYRVAIGDMLDRTSTTRAPWTIVEAEDKRYARVTVLDTLVAVLESRIV